MQSFAKQLSQFALIGLIILIACLGASYVLVNNHLNESQAAHAEILQSVSKSTTTQDTKLFAKQLKASFNYAKLLIKTVEGEQLYHFNDATLTNPLAFAVPEASVTLDDRNITIDFKLNENALANLVLTCVVIFALSLPLFMFILFVLNKQTIVNLTDAQRKQDKQLLIQDLVNRIEITDPNVKKTFADELATDPDKALTHVVDLMSQQNKDQKSLEHVAFIDNLTELANRSRFVQFFENNLSKPNAIEFGILVIVRCSELQTINQIHGYQEGDRYICSVANIIKQLVHTYKNGQVFRLNSSDFACILPNVTITDAELYAKNLTAKFNEYQLSSDLDSVAFTGIVKFESGKPLGELLALADTAISIAQTQHKNAWYIHNDAEMMASGSASYGNQNWRQEIDNVIENRKVKLLIQPIQPISRKAKVYSEILARFLNKDNDILPTAPFIAMAEKLDKIVAIDRLIVETAIETINSQHMLDQSFAINLSPRSIHDEHFLIWLERKLLKEAAMASRLVIEISEFGLQQNIKTSKRFIDMIHRVGAKVTVERFGVGLTSFKFFKELKPDFIKMDGSYTRNIEEDKNNQYFLRLMIDLAHRISVTVLAESVETLEEKQIMETLCIDGIQGYFIGKPAPI